MKRIGMIFFVFILGGCSIYRAKTPAEAFVENFITQDDLFDQTPTSSQIFVEVLETYFTEEELNLINRIFETQEASKVFNNFIETGDAKNLESFRRIVKKNGAENCFAKFGQEEFQIELSSALQEKVVNSSINKCVDVQNQILDLIKNGIE